MLEIKQLYKSYGKQKVLTDINALFQQGNVVGVIGPNGCGKTTLIKSILGLVKPDKGEIYYNNVAITNHSQYRQFIGYMPQIGRYPENMSIRELFEMLKEIRGNDYAELDEELISQFHLKEIERKTLGSLSGGTIQKVSAACAYLFNPDILIFDEPTAGLDPIATEILKDKISRDAAHKITLVTSHILNDLEELATHILFLNEQKVFLFVETEKLRSQFNNVRLSKAIAQLMIEHNSIERD